MRLRGYYGIGVYKPKTAENIGTLLRSAHAFGADFVFTIGNRYRKQPSDTTDAAKHIPLFQFSSLEDFESHKPTNCKSICIEITDNAVDLREAYHPERAVYILGAEDTGLPEEYMRDKEVIKIGGLPFCLNVAVAGSLVLYDRSTKRAF